MDKIPANNALILKTLEIMEGITIQMLKVDNEPRLKMVLVIDENTNFDAINKNRKIIKTFLKELEKVQGSNLNEGYAYKLYDLLRWHEEGISWKNMMLMLNYLAPNEEA